MEVQDLQKIKNKFDIVGNNSLFNRALETAVAIAPTDLSIIITGESGAGKDVLPKIIHQYSKRKNAKYIAVNCAAIPKGTMDSELFGHEKGSFTGAIETRKGYFEEADGGTLFLDEIGEMPLESQAKLLRVLQNGEFMKVGSSKVQKTNVRVVAATNINISHAISKGKFRADLYYRLSAINIFMPALRDRKDDIYLLFRKFSADFSERNLTSKVNLSHKAIALLKEYRWPGNIRQLRNVTEAITAIESQQLDTEMDRIELSEDILSKYLPIEDDALLPAVAGNNSTEGSSISDLDKAAISKALWEFKQELDKLKDYVYHSMTPKKQLPEAHNIEEQWQSADVEHGKSFDFSKEKDLIDEQSSEKQEESLSIKERNADLVRKALEKHNGNRKLAAQELGISERTLYRRISH